MTTTIALIVAAGRGERAGGGTPKQYRPLGGVPVLRRSLMPFLHHPRIDAVAVVIADGHQDHYAAATGGLTLLEPIIGGAERQESVFRGLEAIAPLDPAAVLIHDAARPFVPSAIIDRVLDALADAPASLPVLPVVDTLKRGDSGRVVATLPRDDLWRAQTPQGFRFESILMAHREAAKAGCTVTDDSALAERAGLAVALVDGSEDAFKLTTRHDLERAERYFSRGHETRVGTGFDVHRIGPGDAMVLGGVSLAHDGALIGHSDADVALHAITDAVLGALADGDIGAHFPPSDPRWRGASSDRFLADAVRRVRDRGGRIVHIDLTIICERPKIGPHRAAIRTRVAEICGVSPGRVSVKATTTERLGFAGRGEGVAAQAVATLALPDEDDGNV